MKTLNYENIVSDFTKYSSLNPSIIYAVVQQMGDEESFVESARDIANYGIDGGFGGFIYYNETVKFAENNLSEIFSMLEELAREVGSTINEVLLGFNSLRSTGITSDDITICLVERDEQHEYYTTLFNTLAWFAGEEVSRAFSDWAYSFNHEVNEFADYAD